MMTDVSAICRIAVFASLQLCGCLQVWAFRKREKAAVAVSAGLRKRLNDTLTDPDAV